LSAGSDDAYYGIEGDGSPVVHSIAFDGVITTLFGPFLRGQPLHLPPHDREAEILAAGPPAGGPHTLVKLTPSHLKVLNQELADSGSASPTHALMIGGEALVPRDIAFWQKRFPDVRLINHYGPTEATVGCCTLEIREPVDGLSSIPIGRPIWNSQLHVLDPLLQPLPPGVVGELYIGGAGLARGYLNRPDLTAERFIADPYGPPGSRLYRTGDLARRRSDGTIDFLGRTDHQVKIRGFRIELREIEAAMARAPGVAQAVVVACADRTGNRRLIGYFVPAAGMAPEPAALRAFLANELPDYMVPAGIQVLAALPVTPNGKLDTRALPVPDFVGAALARPPRTPAEQVLCGLFGEITEVPVVGIDDNFFELGGHSLLAMRLIGRIRAVLGVDLPIRTLFEAPTVAELADRLDGSAADTGGFLAPFLALRRTGLATRKGRSPSATFTERLIRQSKAQPEDRILIVGLCKAEVLLDLYRRGFHHVCHETGHRLPVHDDFDVVWLLHHESMGALEANDERP
ncbi:non-ribosomal peptide synthetase, partial [Azospirillum sp. B506]|uniref:non-ribosomal peptide synthetase n=1 Tax=Azospirillum sp. B506 TaxID=137721 RepID=UPI0005B26758